MRKASRPVGLALFGSVLALAAACGSTATTGGFGAPGGSSSGSGNGGGDASASSSGGSSGSSSGGIGNFGDGSAGGDDGSAPLGDSGCATATAKATKTPVYMLFILDGSGSMSQDSKWSAATQALEAIFADMQKQADTGVGVGLIVFSDSKDPTHASGPYPSKSDVSINFVGAAQVSALDGRLSGQPSLGTPTGTALKGGYGELASYVPLTPIPPGGQKVLVLMTDGVPTDNCAQNGGSYTSNACVMEAAQELTATPPTGPVLTFVIGTGVFPSSDLTNFDPNFLGNLAEAGGTGPKGCNPNENTTSSDLCYFEVDPTAGSATQTEQAFEAAINAIRGQVLSCTFPLNVDSEAGTVDPSKVNVTVDGTTIPQSSTNGWSYNDPNDPTQIVFNGQACTNLKNDPNASVQIVLGCATVTAQ
ncbi:MAG TPA: vWA domain-containing protein [Polyangiaceae bacterium]